MKTHTVVVKVGEAVVYEERWPEFEPASERFRQECDEVDSLSVEARLLTSVTYRMENDDPNAEKISGSCTYRRTDTRPSEGGDVLMTHA